MASSFSPVPKKVWVKYGTGRPIGFSIDGRRYVSDLIKEIHKELSSLKDVSLENLDLWSANPSAFLESDLLLTEITETSARIPLLLRVKEEGLPSKKARLSQTGIDDVAASTRYFEELLKPPETLPRTVGELNSFLSEIPVKLRVRPELYGAVQGPSLFESDESNACGELKAFIQFCVSQSSNTKVALNEATNSHYLMTLTGEFMKSLNKWASAGLELTNLECILDSVPDSSLSQSRPDFQLFVRGCIIVRWESELDYADVLQAVEDNKSKMCKWSPMFYGTLPYVIGGVCAGNQLTWLKLFDCDGRGNIASEVISRDYDLKTKRGILQFLHSNVRIHCLLQKLQGLVGLATATHPLYRQLKRENGGTVTYYPDKVVKVVLRDTAILVVKKLESLYDLIKGSTHLIQSERVTMTSRRVVLHLTPLGDPDSKPSNLSELEDAAHDLLHGLVDLHQAGFTHRDLRWANVIKVLVEGGACKWVIIDLEGAGCVDDE